MLKAFRKYETKAKAEREERQKKKLALEEQQKIRNEKLRQEKELDEKLREEALKNPEKAKLTEITDEEAEKMQLEIEKVSWSFIILICCYRCYLLFYELP